MKRFSPFVAVVALVAAMAIPAVALAIPDSTPVNITNWAPTRTDDSLAGKWQSVAVNPTNGRRLVAMQSNYNAADGGYLAGLYDESGSMIGGFNVIATGAQSGEPANIYGTGPTVAYNPKTGGWIVVYLDGSSDNIKAQLLNADGSNSGSAQAISGTFSGPCCNQASIAWDSAEGAFFVTWTPYSSDGEPQGRFVDPQTGFGKGTGPIDLITNSGDFAWDDYHQGDVAYSPKHDSFGYVFRGYLNSTSGPMRPYFVSLDSNGEPTAAPEVISSGSDLESNNPSIAYSRFTDQYAVAWSDYSETGKPILVQRFSAASGNTVGSPVVQNLPADALPNERQRPRIEANELEAGFAIATAVPYTSADEYWATTLIWLDGKAETIASDWIDLSLGYQLRPQIAFDRHSGCYAVTFVAHAQGDDQDYNLYMSQVGAKSLNGNCSKTSAGGKPTLKKSGTAGSTSLRVKVGCGGASACRIKLSGKLKGGSGKLQGKTVKVKAGKKKTVTLDYSDPLISELVGRSGSKIKVTAKQVGGKSRTITVAVPDSVTG